MLAADLRRAQGVFGFEVIHFGDHPFFEGGLYALHRQLGTDEFDFGLFGITLGIELLFLGQNVLASHIGLQLLQGRLLAFQGLLHIQRLNHGQHLPFFDGVTRFGFERYAAGCSGIQRGADSRDHTAIDCRIAHQIASSDLGNTQTRGADRLTGANPGLDRPSPQKHNHQGDCHSHSDLGGEARAGVRKLGVLARSVADHAGSR